MIRMFDIDFKFTEINKLIRFVFHEPASLFNGFPGAAFSHCFSGVAEPTAAGAAAKSIGLPKMAGCLWQPVRQIAVEKGLTASRALPGSDGSEDDRLRQALPGRLRQILPGWW